MNIKEYFEHFVGEEPDNGNIVIYDDEDMKRFEEDMRKKWASDHKDVIEDWQAIQNAKMQECDYCGKMGINLVEYDGRLMHEECAADNARADAFWGGWG